MTNYYSIEIKFDTTLYDVIWDEFSLFSFFKNKEADLLNYTAEAKTNRELILEQYFKDDQTAEATYITSGQLRLVKAGTILNLPKGALEMDLVALQGRNLFVKNAQSFKVYYGSYLDLLQKDGFTPAFRDISSLNDIDVRDYQVSLWVWSRAYSRDGTALIDLTHLVESLTTDVNGEQNTFSINLQAGSEKATQMGDELLSQINLDQNITKWSAFDYIFPGTQQSEALPISWLEKILQQNDIVFIRFERLALEKPEDRTSSAIEVSSSRLPGKVFDMIGLIETVQGSYNAESTDYSISITGGDCTRLLIEDGAYFFPLLFTENADTLFFNSQDDSKWFKRNFIKGVFENLFIYNMQSIADSLGFVVNQLSNLGVCNDELFKAYDENIKGLGGRRAQAIKLTGDKKNIAEWNVVSGIWQIVDLLVDEQIADRRIANSQISNPNSNLLGVVDSFCEKPFVEFFGDTYGDKFTFIARQPPFTKEAIQDALNSGAYINVNLRDVEQMNLSWETTFYSWFQMDPKNMFLGKSDSIALAYLPIVYFPEIAEAFGNKQFTVTDNYISNRALTGQAGSIAHDEFKQKVIEDYLYVLDSYCYLPFTRTGTITLKRDRRIKAKTWVKVGNQFFYIDSVSNSFTAVGERIAGNTTLNVSRGLFCEYINGKYNEGLRKQISYWDIIQLDVIKKVLIQKLIVLTDVGDDVTIKVPKNTVKASFGTNKDVFDFFLQRRFLYE
jgi:hypothetical protein